MANNNVYGTVKQAIFNPSVDCDIYYHYKPSRSKTDVSFSGFKRIDNPSTILTQAKIMDGGNLPGMYNLSLPVSIFGKIGIYTVYIVPKEIQCTIKDVGALVAYPDIRGLVIDINEQENNVKNLFKNDMLTGYRIEYMEANGAQQNRTELFTIITSNYQCEPVTQNITSSNTDSHGYRYNVNGSYCFITVTPSLAPTFKFNSKPYIGVVNQNIVIKNTKFDPVCLEINITQHDIETISYMLEGDQVRNLENGRVTTYTPNGEIYKQVEYSTIKDNYTTNSIAEIKIDKSNNIDRSLDINLLKNV